MFGLCSTIAQGLAVAAPPVAEPEPQPALIERANDAHACLEVEAIAQQVERWLGHAPEGDLDIVLRGDQGFGFDLLRAGTPVGQRRFVDEGQACAQVVQIVGLAIALAIEDQMREVVAPILEPEALVESEPSAPSPPPRPPPEPLDATPAAPAQIGLGPVVGLSTQPALGVELGAAVAWTGVVSVRSELSLGYRPSVVLRDDAHSSSSHALIVDGLAALDLCLGSALNPNGLVLSACLGARGGPLFGRGVGLEPNRWALTGWLAATTGLVLDLPTARVRYVIAAQLLVTLLEPTLRTTSAVGDTVESWTGAGLGGRLSFAVVFDPTGSGPRRQ